MSYVCPAQARQQHSVPTDARGNPACAPLGRTPPDRPAFAPLRCLHAPLRANFYNVKNTELLVRNEILVAVGFSSNKALYVTPGLSILLLAAASCARAQHEALREAEAEDQKREDG